LGQRSELCRLRHSVLLNIDHPTCSFEGKKLFVWCLFSNIKVNLKFWFCLPPIKRMKTASLYRSCTGKICPEVIDYTKAKIINKS